MITNTKKAFIGMLVSGISMLSTVKFLSILPFTGFIQVGAALFKYGMHDCILKVPRIDVDPAALPANQDDIVIYPGLSTYLDQANATAVSVYCAQQQNQMFTTFQLPTDNQLFDPAVIMSDPVCLTFRDHIMAQLQNGTPVICAIPARSCPLYVSMAYIDSTTPEEHANDPVLYPGLLTYVTNGTSQKTLQNYCQAQTNVITSQSLPTDSNATFDLEVIQNNNACLGVINDMLHLSGSAELICVTESGQDWNLN